MNRMEDLTSKEIREIAKEITPNVVRVWIAGLMEMDLAFREAAASMSAFSISIAEDSRFYQRRKAAMRHAHAFAEACK